MDPGTQSSSRRKIWVSVLFATIPAIFFILCNFDQRRGGPGSYVAWVEHAAMDWFFQIRGSIAPKKKIVVVKVDLDSYRRLQLQQRLPWPRRKTGELLKTFERAGARLCLLDFHFSGNSLDPLDDEIFIEKLGLLPTFIGITHSNRAGSLEVRVPPTEILRSVAGFGELNLRYDFSGRFRLARHFPQGYFAPTVYVPSMVESVADFLGYKNFPSLKAGLDFYRHYLNYYGDKGVFRTFSAAEVLLGEVADVEFKDAIVIVGPGVLEGGTSLSGIREDLWNTPFNRTLIIGAKVHATALANIMSDEWISRLPALLEAEIQLFFILFAVFAVLVIAPPWNLLFAFSLVFCSLMASYQLWLRGIYIPLLVPNIFIIFSVLVHLLGRGIEEARRRYELIQVFGTYLDPHVVSHYVESRSKPSLEGTEECCALMFTDIQGFTSFSESLPPLEVGKTINKYFDRLVRQLRVFNGTLLSYVGDGIFAVWGAPLKLPNPCQSAYESAQAIVNDQELNFYTRIGLHYGPVLLGNFGAQEKINYTAMGDSVNLTSRLESLNKLFDTQILMSDQFVRELRSADEFIYLGDVQLLGKQQGVGLYTLAKSAVDPRWGEAIESFKSRDIEKSKELFTAISMDLDKQEAFWALIYLQQLNTSPELEFLRPQNK